VIGDLTVKICAGCVTDADCEDYQYCEIGGWKPDMDEIRPNYCNSV
jgi:hypothetical protein